LAGNPLINNMGSLGNGNGVGLTDIVGNLRIDQAWGSAQISAALHDARAGYYGPTENLGHPGDKWGWAASAGLRLNAPMIGPGDYFQAAVVYAQGATKYAAVTPSGNTLQKWNGNEVGFGFWEDGVYGNGTDVELTTAWSLFASYEHFWTPSLRTSVYGSYIDVSHNAAATTLICNSTAGAGTGGGINPFAVAAGGVCSADWSAFNIGTRTQWNITKSLYVGLDVIYQKLNTAMAGNTLTLTNAVGAKPAGTYFVRDQDSWTATWRIQRDIVP
jgi:hypothetical protein